MGADAESKGGDSHPGNDAEFFQRLGARLRTFRVRRCFVGIELHGASGDPGVSEWGAFLEFLECHKSCAFRPSRFISD